MKKRKILFVMESLEIGGAEKSLITILNMIDKEQYDIDLFLFNHHGDFMNFIPKEVKLLPPPEKYEIFIKNRKLAPIKFLLRGDIKSFYNTLLWLVNAGWAKLRRKKIYIGWNHICHLFDCINTKYHTSIAFLERKTMYFNVDKVNSKNKIGFIHNDYSVYPYDEKLDKHYFQYYNKIPTVSEHCREVLIEKFPEYEEKFIVIKNMISKELILGMSKMKIDGVKKNEKEVTLVSVGRLVKQKGFDIAINVCKKLIDKNIDIKWYVVGEGPEKENLKKKIGQYNLDNNFILVGSDINPYRWMNIADVYVQPSRFEGYGITVAEAKVLNKPIVASDIKEFDELLSNNRGILAKDEDDFVESIISVIENQILRNSLVSRLNKEVVDYKEIDILYNVIESGKHE